MAETGKKSEKDSSFKTLETTKSLVEAERIRRDIAVELLGSSYGIVNELKEQLGLKNKLVEQDRALLSLARQASSALSEDTKELRRSNKLESQILKEKRLIAKIRKNEALIQRDLSSSSTKHLFALKSIVDTVGIESELYQKVLKRVHETERAEVNKILLAQVTQDNLKEGIKLKKEELEIQTEVNRHLGLAGALTDNLQRIGLRAFGGLGINLSVFEGGIKEAREEAHNLAENFVNLDRFISNNNLKTFKKLRESVLFSSKATKDMIDEISKEDPATLLKGSFYEKDYKKVLRKKAKVEDEIKAEILRKEKDYASRKRKIDESSGAGYSASYIKGVETRKKTIEKLKKDLEEGTADSLLEIDKQVQELARKEAGDRSKKIVEDFKATMSENAQTLVKTSKYADEYNKIRKKSAIIEKTLQEKITQAYDEREKGLITEGQLRMKLGGLQTAYTKKREELSDRESEILSKVTEQARQQSIFTKQMRVIFTILPGVGKALKGGILDPLTVSVLFGKILVNTFRQVNKAQTEFRRLTGETGNVFAQLQTPFANGIQALETMSEITKTISINSQEIFSPSTLVRLTEAKNLLGLTNEETSKLAIFSKFSADSVESFENSFDKGVQKANKLSKSAVSNSIAFKDVLNTSDGIALSMGLSGEKIGEAATAARALGTELKTVDSIASSLLDFESSIESELQAQLLTGKELNLAKARELALNNDLAGVSREVTENLISSSEFANMNRIAQEGLAKSIGVGRDELAKMIIQQDINNELTESQRANMMNMTLEQYKHLEAADSLRIAFTSISQAIVGVIEPMAAFLAQNKTLLQTITYIGSGLLVVNGLLKTGVTLNKLIYTFTKRRLVLEGLVVAKKKIESILGTKILAKETASAIAKTIALGGANLLTGAAAAATVAGLIYGASKMFSADDLMSPGYGDRVLTTPEGTFALNNKDTVIAGTNLTGTSNNNQMVSREMLSSFNDIKRTNKELTERFDRLISIVEKGGTVNIDGRYAGEALVLGSYNSA